MLEVQEGERDRNVRGRGGRGRGRETYIGQDLGREFGKGLCGGHRCRSRESKVALVEEQESVGKGRSSLRILY